MADTNGGANGTQPATMYVFSYPSLFNIPATSLLSPYYYSLSPHSNIKQAPEGYTTQSEGKATILQKGNEAFYNPAQVINRDLSIAVINYYSKFRQQQQQSNPGASNRSRRRLAQQPTDTDTTDTTTTTTTKKSGSRGLQILEGLAATGLRSIRYAREIEGVDRIVANDLDPNVVASMRRNLEFNGPDVVEKIVASVGDARVVMMQNPNTFDVVDLDPYGSPCQLLDSAVQTLTDGGLLCMTATDMAVLCGNNGEACFTKYGSYPLHRSYCHEMALRILLSALSAAAARCKRYIVPVLSFSIDFYVRVFVLVYDSAAITKDAATKLGYVYQSQGCDAFYWQRVGRKIAKGNSMKYTPGHGPSVPSMTCPYTGQSYSFGGPYWAEALHDVTWAKGVLSYIRSKKDQFAGYSKIQGLLTTAIEELPDAPFFINLHDICKTVKCTPMRGEVFRSALINAGYRVSGTHCSPLGIKTDAPWDVVWDIMRCWVAQHPNKLAPGSVAEKILSVAPELKADFTRVASAVHHKGKGGKKIARYPMNPAPNWGPKMKHGRRAKGESAAGEDEGEGDEGDVEMETKEEEKTDT